MNTADQLPSGNVSMPRAASLCFLLLLLAGCKPPHLPSDEQPTPTVSVALPVEREITDMVDFTGRTEAQFAVDIRPRVTGYLTKMPFKEGAEVEEGALLFQIDERPYQDDLDRAKGELERNKATLVKSQADLDIALDTQKQNPGAVSKQEIARRTGSRDEAAAQVVASEAQVARSKLNLDWCKVTSPIKGKVSRYFFTVGNLVNQDTTLLTTVVSEDPMYVYFEVDDRTLLRITRTLEKNPQISLGNKKFKVLMGLPDETGYPHTGYINFANNVVDPATGTITVRGVFDNPEPKSGPRLMKPGMFVRVRLPISIPHSALLVAERAIGTDQGQKFLYLVGPDNKVQYSRVELGALQSDGLRAILSGLKPTDRVVVSGLQLIRTGQEVKVETTTMQAAQSGETAPPPAQPAPSPSREPVR